MQLVGAGIQKVGVSGPRVESSTSPASFRKSRVPKGVEESGRSAEKIFLQHQRFRNRRHDMAFVMVLHAASTCLAARPHAIHVNINLILTLNPTP